MSYWVNVFKNISSDLLPHYSITPTPHNSIRIASNKRLLKVNKVLTPFGIGIPIY
jgi:hypothetical protein